MGGVPVPGVTGCGLGYTLVHHRVKSDCSVSVDRVSSLAVCITSSGRQEAHMTSKDKGQRPDVAAGSSRDQMDGRQDSRGMFWKQRFSQCFQWKNVEVTDRSGVCVSHRRSSSVVVGRCDPVCVIEECVFVCSLPTGMEKVRYYS